jgi:myo-inositol-1(or 4)-monophosphatase
MDEVQARLDLALAVARAVAPAAMEFFRGRSTLLGAFKDNPQDVVSRADAELETLIRSRIAASFPDDGFIGEEHGEAPGTSGYLWLIDPIDGTMAFLHGLPHWCISLAIRRGDATEAAVITVPVADETFSARRGGGATLNGARLHLGDGLAIGSALTGIGASHRAPAEPLSQVIRRLLERGGMFYRNGSGAAMLAYVAAGRLAAYYEPHMYPWDGLGGLLLVEEAGGRTLPYRPDGGLRRGAPVLAASPAAWQEMVDIIG